MLILLVQTKLGLEEVATTSRLSAAVSASRTTKFSGVAMPLMGMERSGRSVMVGGLFWPLTVTVNTRTMVLLTLWPSSTVTVMVAVPLALAAGLTLRLPVLLGLK